jgi:hypothetical protein
MADTTRAFDGPVTEDALIAERQRFWGGFMNATTAAVCAIVVLLILLAIFLL